MDQYAMDILDCVCGSKRWATLSLSWYEIAEGCANTASFLKWVRFYALLIFNVSKYIGLFVCYCDTIRHIAM